jgi:hypothetical protein
MIGLCAGFHVIAVLRHDHARVINLRRTYVYRRVFVVFHRLLLVREIVAGFNILHLELSLICRSLSLVREDL